MALTEHREIYTMTNKELTIRLLDVEAMAKDMRGALKAARSLLEASTNMKDTPELKRLQKLISDLDFRAGKMESNDTVTEVAKGRIDLTASAVSSGAQAILPHEIHELAALDMDADSA